MASQEVGTAELGTASAGGTPRSQGEREPEGVNRSVYQRIDRSQIYQEGELQALGVSQAYIKNEFKVKGNSYHVENLICAPKEQLLSYSSIAALL